MSEFDRYPRGFVTYVFTDMEGSSRTTRRIESLGKIGFYESGLRDPARELLLAKVDAHRGGEVQCVGDGHMFVFDSPDDAIACAVEFQKELTAKPITLEYQDERWSIRVRMGIHTARYHRTMVPRKPGPEAALPAGLPEYPGDDTNYASRISGLGVGGQIIVSDETHRRAATIKSYTIHHWPGRFLKSFESGPHDVYEVLYRPGQEPIEPGMRWARPWFQNEQTRYVARLEKEKDIFAGFAKESPDRVRLVTILAGGGMGKSRLAIACASRMADLFPDGVQFISLAYVPPDRRAVVETIAQGLGVAPGTDLEEALLRYLDNRETLLLLDNYESVRDPAVSMMLTRIVTETRHVRLLVTGRSRVGNGPVEQVVNLERGMTEPEARALFVARARRTGTEEPLDSLLEMNPGDTLGRIINPERIPLAIELNAAWMGHQTLVEIADGLEATPLGEFSAVVPGEIRPDSEQARGRHDSMVRTYFWSYNLLEKVAGPEACRVFASAGLFADTFDAATLAIVCGSPKVDALLLAIVGASLVHREGVDGTSRYRLHRFTRAFALDRLEATPDADETRRRFVDHYVALVDANGELKDLAAFGRLDREWRNALAALDVAESGANRPAVMSLVLL